MTECQAVMEKQTNGSKARDGHALTEERRGSPRSVAQTRRTNGASVINVISGNDNASTKKFKTSRKCACRQEVHCNLQATLIDLTYLFRRQATAIRRTRVVASFNFAPRILVSDNAATILLPPRARSPSFLPSFTPSPPTTPKLLLFY
jgi:hypothetical protein